MKIRKDDAYRVYLNCMDAWAERAAGEEGFKRQLPRALEADVETARSRRLAGDDDGERVYCWNRVAWRDEAREHMPDWMYGRYADHFDAEGESDDEGSTDGDDAQALAARDPQYGADLTVTVETVNDGEYSREAQGRLAGAHGTYIGYVVPGGNSVTLDAHEGEQVRLDPVTLRTDDDGLLEAVIDDAVDVTPVEGSQQSLDDDDSGPSVGSDGSDAAAADGGTETSSASSSSTTRDWTSVDEDKIGPGPNAHRIADYIEFKQSDDQAIGYLKTILTQDIEVMTADEFDAAVSKGTENGWLIKQDRTLRSGR
jgi:hypothetical protein